jgi:hypothetical protein
MVETPELIDAMDVVGVVVGVEHRIDIFDSMNQTLLSQVCRCVDQNIGAIVSDKKGRTQSFIATIL